MQVDCTGRGLDQSKLIEIEATLIFKKHSKLINFRGLITDYNCNKRRILPENCTILNGVGK